MSSLKSVGRIKRRTAMFNWIKNKKIKEQKKLLYQNLIGSETIATQFELYGESILAEGVREWGAMSSRIFANAQPDRLVSDEEAETLLWVNHKLRECHRKLRSPKDFDERFKPLDGWEKFYNS